MLTPQEVEERVFPKAKKSGYDMQDVDTFLDELTADYTELYKENALLKRKMKVLADKITEYQETEGAMRATLLTAQKMANELVEDAKAKRTQILEEAENIAKARTAELANQVAEEQARLKSAKASVAEMVGTIRELLAHEQEFLAGLPAMDADAETSSEDAADAVVDAIGDSISRMLSETAEEQENEEQTQEENAAEDKQEEAEIETEAEETTAKQEDDAATRRLDLSQLRFGRNYEIK